MNKSGTVSRCHRRGTELRHFFLDCYLFKSVQRSESRSGVVVVGRKLCDGIRAGTNFTAATHLLLQHAKEALVYRKKNRVYCSSVSRMQSEWRIIFFKSSYLFYVETHERQNEL